VDPIIAPALSADGRFLAFECADGNVVSDDNNRVRDVFVCDLTTDQASLVSSHDPALPAWSPNGYSVVYSTSVSTNGRYVAFVSDGNNLVANDTNVTRDVFVRDLALGTNLLVSVGTNGFAGSGMSTDPAISADGRYVAFSSFADNLVAGDLNRMQDIFVRDLQAGTNVLVSVSPNGSFGDNDSYSPVISADGRYVLFRSKAQNLAAGPYGSGTENLFLRDRVLGTNYALTYWGVNSAAMTPDGHYVVFVGSMLTGGLYYLYVWDSRAVGRIYTNLNVSSLSPVAISPNGHWLAYFRSASAFNGTDLSAGTNWTIAAAGFTSHAGLKFSSEGRFLAYATATNNGFLAQNVYLYDFQTGSNLLVSRGYNSSGPPNGSSDSPVISADGRYVAYRSFASNCAPNDFNDFSDVFLFDRLAGASTLLSPSQTGSTTADSSSFTPVFSADGQVVFLQSWASDLISQDGNASGDVFTFNLPAPAVTDTDGDGMDDQWELEHFDTLVRDGTGDYDGDGVTDLLEFLEGTNPADPASVFRAQIVYADPSGQNPLLTWPAVQGKSYSVQFKNALEETTWQDLNGNVNLIGHTGYATDLVPAIGQRYYRVVLANP